MPEQITGIEQEKPQRTRESEIHSNVEFWQNLGVEVDESEIRATIEALPEKEGFDWYLAIPKGTKMSEVWQKMAESYPNRKPKDIILDDIQMPRSAEETYALATHYSQGPDNDSVRENAKPAEDWEASGKTYMSPLERAVADMRWYAENGTHLDDHYRTMCPGSRMADGDVPSLVYSPNADTVGLHGVFSDEISAALGVREVIVKNMEVGEESLTE